jgi:phosphomannomutase
MIKPSIFKKYDVRGKYPSEIDSHTVEKIIYAYYKIFKPEYVVVGHDPVAGSVVIYETVCNELAKHKVKVYRAEMVSTPMLYFASSHYRISQGLMLTASHLGPAYTGIKIIVKGIPPEPKQIIEMRDFAINIADKHIEKDIHNHIEAESLKNLKSDYLDKIQLIVNDSELNRYKVAIDVSNGPNGKIIKDILQRFGLNAITINEEVKAKDLAHETNPKIAQNREQLVNAVKDNNCDLGIIWDGDGDRAYFVDNNGEIIPPEFVGSIIGSHLIKNEAGTTITVDVRGSTALENELKKVQGTVKRIQAWHVPIKFEMEEDSNIVFGMETSGHYVFRDMYKADDGLLASLMFLKALQETEQNVNELLSDFREKYLILEEINFETERTEQTVTEELKETYQNGEISLLDGISIDYPDWRFNLRSSKTEPVMRLNISGTDFNKVRENLETITKIIGGKISDH